MTGETSPPQTVTMKAFPPVSPIAISKWVKDDTRFLSIGLCDRNKRNSPIPVIEEDSSSSGDSSNNSHSEKSESSTMINRSFSPTNGIDTLILAATDSMRDDDSTSSTTLASNEEHDARSVSSGSSSGRKLRTWQESFEALAKYKERVGNTNVPVRYSQDSALANWVRYQQRNQDSLPLVKRERLESIGFQFGARNDRQWDAKLQRLKEYQQEYGRHAPVRDLELSQWVSTQRSLYKKNLLRTDRQAELAAIGFVWQANQKHLDPLNFKSGPSQTRRDAQWKVQFERLKEFHRENGHFRVPNQFEKDPSLGIWVSNQRSIHNRGQLPENRKSSLDSIGFVWRVEAKDARASLYQKQWEQQLEGLLQYKLLHGNCDVPSNFEKRGLGVWVVVQKEAGRKGSLDALRAEKLLSTGLTWGDERDTCWTKNFVKLQAYLVGKKVGTEVYFDEITTFDAKLGNWIKLQCVTKKHKELSLKRGFLLENIGCQWDGDKMIVMTDAMSQLQSVAQEHKTPTLPLLPDMAHSAPKAATKKSVAPIEVKRLIAATTSTSPALALKRHVPSVAKIAPRPIVIGLKRRVSTNRPGRDPPGDPPGKRVRRTLHGEEPIPVVVRSDPPGDAPASMSMFTL